MPTLPEPQYGNKGAAERLGIKKNPTWYSYQRNGSAPEPDGYLDGTPWWWESTLDAWQAARPGPGNWTRGEERAPGSIRKGPRAITATNTEHQTT